MDLGKRSLKLPCIDTNFQGTAYILDLTPSRVSSLFQLEAPRAAREVRPSRARSGGKRRATDE
eukprot:6175109-Pleurochrysis_carterae.AAC.3